MFRFLTLDNYEFKGKKVGIRVDINSPIINGKVELNERIKAHCKSILELSKKGGRVVILAHQGRKGKSDFVSLENHAKLLSAYLKKKVKFVSEIYSKNVVDEIRKLKDSEILLLENLRFSKDEDDLNSKNNKILKLMDCFDIYVQDAFSVSHRSQTSIVASNKYPIVAGRVMEKEIRGLNNIEDTKVPHIFLFGGAKPDDLIDFMETSLKNDRVDIILLTGVIGELGLFIKGYYLGKKIIYLKEHHYTDAVNRLKKLLENYSEKIILPIDVAVDKNGIREEIKIEKLEKHRILLDNCLIQDIGSETVKHYSKILNGAGSIYVKGPAGNFEKKGFEIGTKDLFKSVVSSSAFTFMGGGHSVTAASKFSTLSKFSYVSLAGGALVKFLAGRELPGIITLENSFDVYEKNHEDFVVVGSNVMDISVSLPEYLNELKLGDKVLINDNFKISVGGGGMNVSVCMSRLGAKVGYLGKISTESYDLMKRTLDEYKVNIIESKTTRAACAKSILLDTKDKDRIIFTYRGQNSHLELDDFDYKKIMSKNFYFSSLTGESFNTLLKLAKKIRKDVSNANICYNPSSYLIKENNNKLKTLISLSNIVILNYDEAKALVGDLSYREALSKIYKMINSDYGVVVITDGMNGSYSFDGKRVYSQEALSKGGKVYATGAGDAFTGTFFYFYVSGFSIKKSLKFAAINAASVVSKKGALNGQLEYSELIKE